MLDAKRLGIIQMNMEMAGKKVDTVRRPRPGKCGATVHIEVDPRVKPIQQKRRTIALQCGQTELKKEAVISGPLGSEWARWWIYNPV